MRSLLKAGFTFAVIFGVSAWSAGARAQSLPDALLDLIENHDRINAAKNSLDAATSRIRETRGAWFPELEIDFNNGFQKRANPGTQDTAKKFNETSLSITQLLWDFGKTDTDIGISRKNRESAAINLNQVRQDLVLEGIVAYIQVYSANRRLILSRQSEDNIKKQTELEDARVAGGAGFSTDVLQAKTELAEAQSRRVVAEGTLRNALSRYHALYRDMPKGVNEFKLPPVPEVLMPRTLEEAIEIGLKENFQLRNARLASDIAKDSVTRTRQDLFFPELNAVVETSHERNLDGTIGQRNAQAAKVELNFPFNLGFTALDSVNASSSDYKAAIDRAADTQRTIEENIRLAWADLETARQNHDVRTAQVEIAAKFLELAREEREAGRRSLLDVLSGETRLINAQSDSVLTEVAIVQATFRLLNAMGRLEVSAVEAK
ncbi:TolC family protein [Thalassospiraceae bacterium LMO-SO8]|nr:TolC family protein [Alphaproteobacteria bacterium LMO-S08]WND74637.1 TolC family protein [Thalassospiraceae bacterium LMO-SO8]